MFYAAFPPEINSGRMYTGPGSGSMLAAAAAWDGLATELQSTAAVLFVGDLGPDHRADWVGPSSLTMAAAVTPYVDLDAGHRRAGRRNRDPGDRGGKRL